MNHFSSLRAPSSNGCSHQVAVKIRATRRQSHGMAYSITGGESIFFSLFAVVLLFVSSGTAQILQGRSGPKFSSAVAFDKSAPLRDLASTKTQKTFKSSKVVQIRPERGPVVRDTGFLGDAAVQRSSGKATAFASPLAIPSPLANFEGLCNQDNFNIFGGRVNPPDPVGDVGPNHYVEMINLVFAVYSKSGTLLLGPVDTGTLWAGFAVPDCTDPSATDRALRPIRRSVAVDPVHHLDDRLNHSGTAWRSRRPAIRPVLTTAML